MRLQLQLAFLSIVAAPYNHTSASDLTKIPRSIAREPAYRTSAPKYCLLVFGREAKGRVWLVLDGEILYVDRNEDGDLTDPDEQVLATSPTDDSRRDPLEPDLLAMLGARVFKARLTGEHDGQNDPPSLELLTYSVCHLDKTHTETTICETTVRALTFRSGPSVIQMASPEFSSGPNDAPIVHFNGPLTIELCTPLWTYPGRSVQIGVVIGTPGVGPNSFAAISYSVVPEDIHPVAEIEFPSKEADKAALKKTVILTGRC